VGALAALSKASGLIFYGEECRPAWEAAKSGGFRGFLHFETSIDRVGIALRSWLREGDLVLLKASRGMALERLLDSIPR
jgi:UDP-N-acetylmuramyl pentapeptide synthase